MLHQCALPREMRFVRQLATMPPSADESECGCTPCRTDHICGNGGIAATHTPRPLLSSLISSLGPGPAAPAQQDHLRPAPSRLHGPLLAPAPPTLRVLRTAI